MLVGDGACWALFGVGTTVAEALGLTEAVEAAGGAAEEPAPALSSVAVLCCAPQPADATRTAAVTSGLSMRSAAGGRPLRMLGTVAGV